MPKKKEKGWTVLPGTGPCCNCFFFLCNLGYVFAVSACRRRTFVTSRPLPKISACVRVRLFPLSYLFYIPHDTHTHTQKCTGTGRAAPLGLQSSPLPFLTHKTHTHTLTASTLLLSVPPQPPSSLHHTHTHTDTHTTPMKLPSPPRQAARKD